MKHNYHKIPGWFNYSEMYDLAIEHMPKDGKILEIGCFLGKSTSYLLTNLCNAGREDVTVWALDTFKGSSEHTFMNHWVGVDGSFKQQTAENLKYFIGRNQCHLIESRSDDEKTIASFDDGFFDMIMVDGAHEYDAVKDDVNNWWPKLKDDGIMLLDDMYMESVRQAAHDTLIQKVPNFLISQGRESTGLAVKGKNQDSMSQWKKLIPEEVFSAK